MDQKDIQREMMDALRLAERGQIILDLNNQVVALQQKVVELEKQVAKQCKPSPSKK